MGYGWNNPVKVDVQTPNGSQIIESTPKKVISNPNRHRFEDILNCVCAVLSELIIMAEVQGESHENVLKVIQNKVEEKKEEPKKRLQFKRKGRK